MASGQVQRVLFCAFGFEAVFTPGSGSDYWMDGPQGLQGIVSFMHIKFKFSGKAAYLPTSQVSCLCLVFLAKSNKKRCKKRTNLHQVTNTTGNIFKASSLQGSWHMHFSTSRCLKLHITSLAQSSTVSALEKPASQLVLRLCRLCRWAQWQQIWAIKFHCGRAVLILQTDYGWGLGGGAGVMLGCWGWSSRLKQQAMAQVLSICLWAWINKSCSLCRSEFPTMARAPSLAC